MRTFRTIRPARALTVDPLDGSFGSDRSRRLIVTLTEGDLIAIRPQGTRRTYTVRACDVLRFIMRSEATRATLERARVAKEKRAIRLAEQRQKRAERKLREPVLQ